MSWPDVDPVWQFCWVRPQNSSGPTDPASSLERLLQRPPGPEARARSHRQRAVSQWRMWRLLPGLDVHGTGVPLEQRHLPGLLRADGPSADGLRAAGDRGRLSVPRAAGHLRGAVCFTGVAAEKLADRLVMTAQTSAGWYRYTMRWTFHLDGRIEPFIGYAAVGNPCPSYPHSPRLLAARLRHRRPGERRRDRRPNPSAAVEPARAIRRSICRRKPCAEQPAGSDLVDRRFGTHRGYRLVPGTRPRSRRHLLRRRRVAPQATSPTRSTMPASRGRHARSSSTTSSTERACRRSRVLVPHRRVPRGRGPRRLSSRGADARAVRPLVRRGPGLTDRRLGNISSARAVHDS